MSDRGRIRWIRELTSEFGWQFSRQLPRGVLVPVTDVEAIGS
jgi:hypothetical protein